MYCNECEGYHPEAGERDTCRVEGCGRPTFYVPLCEEPDMGWTHLDRSLDKDHKAA